MVPLWLNSASPLSLAQQPERWARIPWWAWILVIFFIAIVVGIIITLKEEQEGAVKQIDAPPVPEPAKPKAAKAKLAQAGAEPVTPPSEPAPPPSQPRPDNLKLIKGIGPKIEKLLKDNGITTFAQLADTELSRLQNLLSQAGWEKIADPTTWPEQARQLSAQ